MSPPDPLTEAEPLPPRRLDPRTILLQVLKRSPSAVLGIPVLLAWSRGQGVPLGMLLAVTAILLGGALVAGWLRWRFFTYQILPGQLVIERGLIHRTRRSIPAERIQDVSIKQGPLSRLLGLAEVQIETGGGEANEGRLASVSLSEAHRLREVLRSLRTGTRPIEVARAAGDRDDEEAETVVYRMGPARLLYSGLFKFSLVWLAAIFGALQYFDQMLGLDQDQWLDIVRGTEREVQSRLNGPVLLSVAGIAIGLGLLAGIVRTVLQNFGFALAYTGARFRYRRGLLTRTEVVVARRQIQLGLVERGTVSGRLGWRALKVQTLAGSDNVSGRQELVPFARPGELAPIIALAGLPPFERSGLQPVSQGHVMIGLLGYVLIPTVVLLASAAAFLPVGLLLTAMPFALGVALSRRRCHRYALAGTSLQVTRGVLAQREWTVPFGNIQAVAVRRGPFQRLLGIATVRIDTAGGRGLNGPHIHDVEVDKAIAFVDDLTARVEALRSAPHPAARFGD